MGRTIKTTREEIYEYWLNNIPVNEIDLNFDWSDGLEVCWNCGDIIKTQKCHIKPHALGGEDTPSNYVLLCDTCHREAPDIFDEYAIWDWIKSNKMKYIDFYGGYWIDKSVQLYEQKHNCIIFDHFMLLYNKYGIEGLMEIIDKEMKLLSRHFGMKIKPSSYLYLFEKIIKDYS